MSVSKREGGIRRQLLAASVLACIFSVVSVAANATPTVIQDGHVQAGVSDYGTLGSDDTNPPGLLYDPTGTGNYGNNDFLTPGTPFEGFYITMDGGDLNYCSNNDGNCSSFAQVSPASINGTTSTWTATTTDGALTVTNLYTLTTVNGKSTITITTTLQNNSGVTMNGIQFLRTLDPDPDFNTFGDFETNNTVVSNDSACAAGQSTNETVCISYSGPLTHKAGVSDTDDWDTNPADWLAGQNGGNGDFSIGMGFDLGDLVNGDVITFTYDYGVGTTLASAGGGGSVPEPSGLAMFGLGALGLLGLFGFDATRRKRRVAKVS